MSSSGPLSPPPALPLSERLRQATQDIHREAERSGAMHALLQGRLPRDRYCLMLRNFHALYVALEASLDHSAASPAVSGVRMPKLYRAPALSRDLEYYGGAQWSLLPVTAAMERYVARLEGLSGSRAHLLVAHAYVRYLGDLSGGQVLRGIVTRSMGLADGIGSAFYDFAPEVDPASVKARFRTALDALPVDAAAAAAIVAEAEAAFALHVCLFDELDDSAAKR